MEQLDIKKAIFYRDKIVLKKKGIIINIDEIDRIEYRKSTFHNYVRMAMTNYFGGFDFTCIGTLTIYLKEKIRGHKIFYIKIKHEAVIKLNDLYHNLPIQLNIG